MKLKTFDLIPVRIMRLGFLFIVIIFPFAESLAQDTLTGFNQAYLRSVLKNSERIITTPFNRKKSELITSGILIMATAATVAVDKEIHSWSEKGRNENAEYFSSRLFSPLGNLYGFMFVGGWYFKGLMEHNNRAKQTALNATTAILINAFLVNTVKLMMNRTRPPQNVGPAADESFNPFEDNNLHDSFYSGHTSTAFAVATVFAKEYREYKWAPYLAYGLASSAGISRIYLQKHWLSDVAAGALIGYYIGSVVNKGKFPNTGLSFNSSTVSLFYRF